MTRFLLTLVLSVAAFAANANLSVEQLSKFIRSSINLKLPDKQVAQYLHTITLREKLDDATIEEYQTWGAGPKTVEMLKTLGTSSNSLPAPLPPAPVAAAAPIPSPDSIEQKRIIAAVREYALNYSKQLPNFICTQVTRRYIDPTGKESWRHMDTINAKLSFFEQKETYTIISVNDRATQLPMDKLGGTTSSGEFGTQLREIFEPSTETEFEWERWATLRGRRAYVFAYRVYQEHSQYHMEYNKTQSIVPGYKGLIYVDKDNEMVVRVTLDPDVPPAFPVQNAVTTLDYEITKIGDSEFMLPLRAGLRSRVGQDLTKNEIEFRLYRKFGAESSITFDTPEALPDDKLKEKP